MRSIEHVQLYQSFIRRLLRGIALSPEDMMDLYSLSDPDADASRLIQALQLFLRSQPTLPRGRADMALDSIWRRAYLATKCVAVCLFGPYWLTDPQLERFSASTSWRL